VGKRRNLTRIATNKKTKIDPPFIHFSFCAAAGYSSNFRGRGGGGPSIYIYIFVFLMDQDCVVVV
jgi:hypothetical protein